MENFLLSVRCVTPVLLTICLGIWIRSRNLFPQELYSQLSTLCFHYLVPVQLFYNIESTQLTDSFSPKLLLFLEAGVLMWFLINFALFSVLLPDSRTRGAYIQNSFRSNIAVVGISLAHAVTGVDGVAAMSIAIAILVPTYNVLAVIALESCRGGKAPLKETVRLILKNPLIRACTLGLLFQLLHLRLPQPVNQAAANIGIAGSVMTLVALGASLRPEGMRRNLNRILFCSAYRLLFTPLVIVGAAYFLGFRSYSLGVILLCAGSPTAATSYPMALACGSDHELTAQIVAATSLLFCLTMIFWVFTLKQCKLL